MKKENVDLFLDLNHLIRKMYSIVDANKKGLNLSYALSKLNNISIYLDEIIESDSEDIEIELVLKEINDSNKGMFFPKAGLSEFYIWDKDFSISLQKNQELDHIKDEIKKILDERAGQ